jgi:ClpP class serine protease
VLLDDFPAERADLIATELTSGKWTHDYPLSPESIAALGLPVSTELPREAFELMELYPQVGRQRPSVSFVPIPYQEPQRTPAPAPPAKSES